MSKGLDSLWIIDSNGMCLLHRVFDKNKEYRDDTMVSGFITAILSFSKDTLEDTIE
ncbi:MAG: hypothetical protein ACTSP4_03770 [Candidatus Hodarchaeales archaeon]